MYIVEALPIKKGVGREPLTYFSAKKIRVGQIINVPLRGGTSWAIATSVKLVNENKAELKASAFSVRKVGKAALEPFYEKSWFRAVEKVSEYFSVGVGELISALTPSVVLENIERLSRMAVKRNNGHSKRNNIKSEVLCIQTETAERWGYYRGAIREEFAKKKSVFMCLPTIDDIGLAVSEFGKGIEKYTFYFHSGLTKAEIIKKWSALLSESHPVLIIATAMWLIVPRADIGLIVLDKENGYGWHTFSRPYIDLRKVVEFFAEEKSAKLLLGDYALRVETIWRLKNDEVHAYEPVKFRISSPAKSDLLEMDKAGGFRAISDELALLLKTAKKDSKKTFIYATRKGLASSTVCKDCGAEVACRNCSLPVVLYKSTRGNFFRCHQCGSERSAKEVCARCGSWRLLPLGVGIERAVEEVEKILGPEAGIFRISSDVTSPTKATQIAQRFYKSGKVLIGTEMALNCLKRPVDYTAIASIDSLFSVPDYRIMEKVFHLVLGVKMLARERCIVQTRQVEKSTLAAAISGNVLDFYKKEIADREALQYPPFSVFIKIIFRGDAIGLEKETKFFESYFEEWKPAIFQSVSERRGEKLALNCVIKVDRKNWPSRELLSKISRLPPHYDIKVDPDNLL